MTSWTPSVLVALTIGEERCVVPIMAADPRGIELALVPAVGVGEEIDLQIRCSAGRRRLLLDVRARVESRSQLEREHVERGHRIRLGFLKPEEPGLQVMLGIARDMGLAAPAERPSLAPSADEPLTARVAEIRNTYLLDAQQPGVSADLEKQLSQGSLMLEADHPVETNTPVLVRLLLADARSLWLAARVVYRGDAPGGRTSLGLALDPLPEDARRGLLQLVRQGAASRGTG